MRPQPVKRLRAVRAINAPVTHAVRAASRLLGLTPEKAIRHLPHSGITTMKLPRGRRARLWSRGDDWVSHLIFWHGQRGYQPEVIPLFWKLASEPHIPGLIPSSSSLSAEFMRAGEHDFASARHLCEVLTRSDVGALTEILEPLGYSFYLLMDDGPQPRHTVAPDPRWLNYYFTTRRPGQCNVILTKGWR